MTGVLEVVLSAIAQASGAAGDSDGIDVSCGSYNRFCYKPFDTRA
jgi:hypothetical protein